MKSTALLFSRPLRFALGILAVSLLFAGCGLTTAEVRTTIDQANYAMLSGEAEPMTDVLLAPGTARGQPSAALARLDAFEAQHKDNPSTLAALQLRRALLHLNNRSFALAKAAFEQIQDPTKLTASRDRTLYDLRETLQWWWPLAPVDLPGKFAPHRAEALAHQEKLLAAARDSKISPELHDYLLEMRAWIGIKLALDLADRNETRRLLEDAVNTFAADFEPGELNQVATVIPDSAGLKPFDNSVRRVLRAQAMLDHLAGRLAARDAINRVAPNFEPAPFATYYEEVLQRLLSP